MFWFKIYAYLICRKRSGSFAATELYNAHYSFIIQYNIKLKAVLKKNIFLNSNNAKISATFSEIFLDYKSMVLAGRIIETFQTRTFFFSVSNEWIKTWIISACLLRTEVFFPGAVGSRNSIQNANCDNIFWKILCRYRKTEKTVPLYRFFITLTTNFILFRTKIN